MKTKLVGILNVTPDSFSDGMEFCYKENALEQVRKLVDDGVDVIEIGAESTRPGAIPLSADDEWNRLEDVLPEAVDFCKAQNVVISLDSYHPENAERALTHGVDWINDVTGFTNPVMIDAVRDSNCKLVVMHNLGVPVDKSIVIPETQDPIEIIFSWGEYAIDGMVKHDIGMERIIFDPGIGFGKTSEQSIKIIKNIEAFKPLGVPLFVGHSRKSFISELVKKTSNTRDSETALISSYLANKGVEYLRVHNVLDSKNAIKINSSLTN